MKKNIHCLFLVLISLIGTIASVVFEASEAIASEIAFVPFRLSDVINPQTNQPAQADDFLQFKLAGKVIYEGDAAGLVYRLNEIEQHYNLLGQSLRTSDHLRSSAVADPQEMKKQFLIQLRISPELALDKMMEPLQDCPMLRLENLGNNPLTQRAYQRRDWLIPDSESKLRVGEFIQCINEQQAILCSLGWSLLTPEDATSQIDFKDLMDKRQQIMTTLGISRYHKVFQMMPKKSFKEEEAIFAEAQAMVAMKQLPKILDLKAIRHQLIDKTSDPIPNFSSIPTVEPVKEAQRELLIDKQKYWDGLKLGQRETFSVEIDGFYMIHGAKQALSANAFAKASLFVANTEMPVLKASIQSNQQNLQTDFFLEIMGTVVSKKVIEHFQDVVLSERNYKDFEVIPQIKQRFMIGPIPIVLTEGAVIRLGIGLNLAFTDLQLKADLGPRADAQGFVWASAGLADLSEMNLVHKIQDMQAVTKYIETQAQQVDAAHEFFAVGAGCSLTIVEFDAGLQGNLSFELDDNAEPMLLGDIDVGLGYAALKGEVFVFLDIPMPRWGLPPWKSKRLSHALFKWSGFQGRQHLVQWGVKATPSSYRVWGDFLDQDDQGMMDAVAKEQVLYRRKLAVQALQRRLFERQEQIYAALWDDLHSDAARKVFNDAKHLHLQAEKIAQLYEPYRRDLYQLLQELQ